MKDKEATKYFSSRQESRVAAAMGWEVVSGSGARDFDPGDVIGDQWMAECKTHVTAGQKIKFMLSVWKKIKEEASSRFRYPVLIVDDGTQNLNRTWVMYPCDSIKANGTHFAMWTKIVKTNVSFDHDKQYQDYLDMRSYLEKVHNTVQYLVYDLEFDGQRVGVCPFRVFQEMFGD